MVRILTSYKNMSDTRDEYLQLNQQFYDWSEAIKNGNYTLSQENSGESETAREEASRVFIFGDLEYAGQAIYRMLSILEEYAVPMVKGLIFMCDDFAKILEGGAAEDLYYNMYQRGISETDTLLFNDEYCNFDGGYGGLIMTTSDAIIRRTESEEEKLQSIEDYIGSLTVVPLDVSDCIEGVRECGEAQKRVEELFHQLTVFGNKVDAFNTYVKTEFDEYIKECDAKAHTKNYKYDGFPDIDETILLQAIIVSAGLDPEKIKALAKKAGISELEAAKMIAGMDKKNLKIVEKMMAGDYDSALPLFEEGVSDDALYLALLIASSELNASEDGTVDKDFMAFLNHLNNSNINYTLRMAQIGKDRLDLTDEKNAKVAAVVGLLSYIGENSNYKNCYNRIVWPLKYIDGVLVGTLHNRFSDFWTGDFDVDSDFAIYSAYVTSEDLDNMTDEERTEFFKRSFISMLKAVEADGKQSASIKLDMGDYYLELDYNLIVKANSDANNMSVNFNDVITDYTKMIENMSITKDVNGVWQIEAGNGNFDLTANGWHVQGGKDGLMGGVTYTYEDGDTITTVKYDAGIGKTGAIQFRVETDTSSENYEMDTTYTITPKPGTPDAAAEPAYYPNPNPLPSPVNVPLPDPTEHPVMYEVARDTTIVLLIIYYLSRLIPA